MQPDRDDRSIQPSNSDANPSSYHLQVFSSSTRETSTTQGGEQRRNTPPWLRPFLRLRIQLTLVYCLLLILAVMLMYTLYSQHASAALAVTVMICIIVIGALVVFLLTTLLLQPLWRVTDAAQAIAMGDLKQRERLPLRLPPQDEVDRLAGSLDKMVTHLEHAEEMQRAS